VSGKFGLFANMQALWRFSYSLLMLKNIKMICRHTQSYLTQAGRDEKYGFVPYKIYLFIKVFALTADR
jgi:hypothetical protein